MAPGRSLRELTLILTDFYFDHDSGGHAAASPRLIGLETALTRATPMASKDWRRWVCGRIGLSVPPRIPLAAIARHAALPAPVSAGQWWLAQCIHLEAGVDRVYMSTDSPALARDEWRVLERGFEAAFGGGGFRLMDGMDAQAFLLSATDLEVDSVDPARVRGADILQALPAGPAATVLTRLMTEIQMWLHDHPVNIARQERGAVTVNGLWIWGGGQWPLTMRTATLPALRSDDRFLDGLWRLAGGVGEGVPQSFQAIDLARDDAMIIALASVPAGSGTAAQALMYLEEAWFRPALASLRRGQVACLQLHLNDRLFVLTRSGCWRWWRRRRPWLELVA